MKISVKWKEEKTARPPRGE